MLVPRFALSQTDKEVVVTVKLPYVRVGDAELSVVRASTVCAVCWAATLDRPIDQSALEAGHGY